MPFRTGKRTTKLNTIKCNVMQIISAVIMCSEFGRKRGGGSNHKNTLVQYRTVISKQIRTEDALDKMFPHRKLMSCYYALAH